MKLVKVILSVLILIGIVSCGDPAVDITGATYTAKIVVQGYVYPNEAISKVRISRNFPLEQNINVEDLVLTPSKNNVIAKINGIELQFDPVTQAYFTDALIGAYGETYTLEINAVVDGKQMSTTSVTTAPQEGFNLLDKDLGIIIYGTQISFRFNPSPGTDFYAFSIVPDTASVANFIYDNLYFPNIEPEDVETELNNFKFQYSLLVNTESTQGRIYTYDVLGLNTWFYSTYKIVVYAGDKNFKDYLLTAANVQQFDGNFIEPRMYLSGDGIGVFGSAIRDTVVFNLVPATTLSLQSQSQLRYVK